MTPGESTVFQAEIMAIKMSMIDLTGRLHADDNFMKLFSASQAAVWALNSSTVKSQLLKDTIATLNLIGGKTKCL